jgi:hypothetical protein
MTFQNTLQRIKKQLEEQQRSHYIDSDPATTKKLERFKGIPFVCAYDQVEPSSEYCCFNYAVGLPLGRHGEPCPIWSWQREHMIEPLMNQKYLWVKKAAGIGCSEIVLRFIAWKCLKDNA